MSQNLILKDIRSKIKNLIYYNNQIKDLIEEQFEKDNDLATKANLDTNSLTNRFKAIDKILSDCKSIRYLCEEAMEIHIKEIEAEEHNLFSKEKVYLIDEDNTNKEVTSESN